MPEIVATWIVNIGLAYFGVGVAFGIPFVLRGARALDADAVEGSWGFRVLILPGAAALWPWLALRWLRANDSGAEQCEERSPHRIAARSASGGPR